MLLKPVLLVAELQCVFLFFFFFSHFLAVWFMRRALKDLLQNHEQSKKAYLSK